MLDLLARKMEKKVVIRMVKKKGKGKPGVMNLIDRQFCSGKYGIQPGY